MEDREPRAMLGHPTEGTWHAEDWLARTEPRYRRFLERVLRELYRGEETLLEGEFPFRDASGRPRWLALAARRMTAAPGQPPEVVGVAVDVTPRREAEGGMEGPVPPLRVVADHLPVLIGFVDRGQRLRYANRGLRRLLGRTRADALGQPLPELLIGRGGRELEGALSRCLGGRPVDLTARWPDAAGVGRSLEVSLVPYRGVEETVEGCFVLLRDRIAQQEAERALESKSRQLEAVLDLVPAAIYTRDRDDRFTAVNRTVEQYLGRPAEAIIGRRNVDLLPPQAAAVLDRADREVLESGAQRQAEEHLVFDDGQEVWFSSIRTPLRDARGQVVGLAGICHDITALKQAEAARLEDARRQGDALVREVHHRSKNRLQGLLGLLQLQYDESPSPPLARAMGQIRAVAVLHDLERRSAERGVGAGELLEELVRSAGQAYGRTCALEAPPGGLRIAPDYAVALSLALSELLTNACKHAPEGAEVRVAAEPGEAGGEMRIKITNPVPEGPPAPSLGTGLASLEAILPPRGAALSIVRRAGRFEAALRLTAPALEAGAHPPAGPGG